MVALSACVVDVVPGGVEMRKLLVVVPIVFGLVGVACAPPVAGPDVSPPTLTLPGPLVRAASSVDGATVPFVATATDNRDGLVPVVCVPPSGSEFAIGSTLVTCEAVDAASNIATGSFTVTVVVDTTPPVVDVPASTTAEATASSGALVAFTATATDDIEGALGPTCVPASGATFPLGTTIVSCEASDSSGNTGSASFDVMVVDTTAPALTLPTPVSVIAPTSAGATVTFAASALDDVDGPLPVVCLPPSGSLFAVGTTTVACEATDAASNTASGSFDVTVLPARLSDATSISAGNAHTCALMADTTVYCWGRNNFGQLGDTTTTDSSLPVLVSGLSGVQQIEAGSSTTCALLTDTSVRCWGYGLTGLLGNGTTDNSSVPVEVPGLTGVTSLSAYGAICTLMVDTTVRCWGPNDRGQLGNGTTDDSTVPVAVPGIFGATSLSVGSKHACVSLSDGTASCWGEDSDGQLGNLLVDDPGIIWYSSPVTVNLTDIAVIETGSSHTCALQTDGELYCWGNNYWGQVGNGGGLNSPAVVIPNLVAGVPDILELVGSVGSHTCVLLADGRTRCWGSNFNGEIGGSSTYSGSPRTVNGLAAATAVASGYSHTCGLYTDTTVKCVGWNPWGQLGDGTTIDRSAVVPVLAP